MNQSESARRSTFNLIVSTVILLLVVIAIVTALIVAVDFFLILLFAILFAVFLFHTSHYCEEKLSLNYGLCLGIVTTLVLVFSLLGFGIFGLQVDHQIEQSSKHLDKANQRISELLEKYPVVKSSIASTPFLNELVKSQQKSGVGNQNSHSPDPASEQNSQSQHSSDEDPLIEQSAIRDTVNQIMSTIASLFQTTFGLLVNSLLIFFVGLFIAVSPNSYRDGVVSLFPPRNRNRAREIMNEMGATLWRWLLGRFGSMLITGVGAGLLLLILGIPMAITLGIVTALLTFIPNIGGLISLILAVIFAIPQGMTVVILVVVGYIVLQLIESYLVTPLIQKKQVSLPPALLIAFQAIMGVLFGLLGAAAASPILAAGKKFIEMAYIEDVLESGNTDD